MTEAISSSALNDLLASASKLSLSDVSGKSVKLNSQTYDLDIPITFSSGGKTFTYSLISLFLQLQNPSIKFLEYKNLCNEYDVKDFVKVTEKKAVLGYFLKDDGGKKVRITSVEEGQNDKDTIEKVKFDDSETDKGNWSKSKRSRDDAAGNAKKKERKEDTSMPISHQQLLENLNTVIDKRAGATKQTMDLADVDGIGDESKDAEIALESVLDASATPTDEPPSLLSQEEEERRAIQACLSATGYEATKLSQDMLERDRLEVEKITSFEIPVGDSGSILRYGSIISNQSQTNGWKPGVSDALNQRNFTRVLQLLEESKREEQHKQKYGSKQKIIPNKAKVQEKITPAGNPIIIVPNAMTSPITLINAKLFFGKASYMPREKCQKTKESTVEITRNVSGRLGGGSITYEIMDNPKKHLKSPSDWDRVVAVVAQGNSWQFKGWSMGWSDANKRGFDSPVEVFSHSFGFYVGFEGAPIPQELTGWNVNKGFLSRDKRGLDSVVFAQFWNGLDEWMNVHKREYIPLSQQ